MRTRVGSPRARKYLPTSSGSVGASGSENGARGVDTSGIADVPYQRLLMHADATDGLMTVGGLSRRTGLSIKAIRQYEGLGLIYSAGRSDGNYRLFDESALWCAQVIETLRSLGLTIREIDQLARAYLNRPEEPIGPRMAALLDASERRIDD